MLPSAPESLLRRTMSHETCYVASCAGSVSELSGILTSPIVSKVLRVTHLPSKTLRAQDAASSGAMRRFISSSRRAAAPALAGHKSPGQLCSAVPPQKPAPSGKGASHDRATCCDVFVRCGRHNAAMINRAGMPRPRRGLFTPRATSYECTRANGMATLRWVPRYPGQSQSSDF